MPGLNKPAPWGHTQAFVDPKWGPLLASNIGLWPFWRIGSPQVEDLSLNRNSADITFGAGGEWQVGPEGPVLHLAGAGGVNTGIADFQDGTTLMCEAGQQWTVVVRDKQIADDNGTMICKGGDEATDRIFQIFWQETGGPHAPSVILRGTQTQLQLGLNDGTFHTHFVTWDGATAEYSNDGVENLTTLSVGTASNSSEPIRFGERGGTGFRLTGDLSFVEIYNRAISAAEKELIHDDLTGRTRMLDEVGVVVIPVTGAFDTFTKRLCMMNFGE